MHDAPLLLTAADVARLLSLTAEGVRGLHRLGRLRGIVVNRRLRWTRGQVEAYVRRIESAASAEVGLHA